MAGASELVFVDTSDLDENESQKHASTCPPFAYKDIEKTPSSGDIHLVDRIISDLYSRKLFNPHAENGVCYIPLVIAQLTRHWCDRFICWQKSQFLQVLAKTLTPLDKPSRANKITTEIKPLLTEILAADRRITTGNYIAHLIFDIQQDLTDSNSFGKDTDSNHLILDRITDSFEFYLLFAHYIPTMHRQKLENISLKRSKVRNFFYKFYSGIAFDAILNF